jgi:ubiquinone/menaquinone biosynthesis C-methylase UbiE
MPTQPTAAGKSGFDLNDVNAFLDTLGLRRDIVFLGVACGVGNSAIETARRMQDTGSVHALDLWTEGITTLRSRADELKKLLSVTGRGMKREKIFTHFSRWGSCL